MDLKELLGEELYNQVTAKLGDHKVAVVSDGNWIPKEKFNGINEEKKQYKTQVDDLNKQLGDLQEKLKGDEEALKTINNLQTQIADKEAEMASIRKNNAMQIDIIRMNPKDVNDILPHLQSDLITLGEDGKIQGLAEQLEKLKEAKGYLFNDETPVGTGGSIGGGEKPKASDKVDSLGGALKAHYNN